MHTAEAAFGALGFAVARRGASALWQPCRPGGLTCLQGRRADVCISHLFSMLLPFEVFEFEILKGLTLSVADRFARFT